MSLALTELPTTALRSELSWFAAQSTVKIVRHISKWVEASLVLPNGPHQDEQYRHAFHPASRIWFEALESRQWSRFAVTAPGQNGKTFMCYVAPVLYHLFELGETVIVGLPSMDMANDKWSEDFRPVIEASVYRDLLPLKGEGSRGGQVKRSITFRNGATLRFMTAGGSDKKRSGYTSRVVAITETDGMDEAGESSREADKIEQIEARTNAYQLVGKRVYLECTVSIERGRIWQEYTKGTESRIARPCPHCKAYVTPEREQLNGWQDAESEHQAKALAFWSCPECKEAWSSDEVIAAAKLSVLVHRGQEVNAAGEVTGQSPETDTLGFRWSAIDNPFTNAGLLGAEEWKAARSKDRANAEKKLRQFVFAIPYEPEEIDLTPLDADTVAARRSVYKRGQVPDNAIAVVVGVDTGKRKLHWVAVAIMPDGSCQVIEYGVQLTEADRLGIFAGLVDALTRLRPHFDAGWTTAGGKRFVPSQVWIDSGYFEHTDAIYAYCTSAATGTTDGKQVYRPTKGYSEHQKHGHGKRYVPPISRAGDVLYIGEQFHIARVRRGGKLLPGVLLTHMNADHWKAKVHEKLAMQPAKDADGNVIQPPTYPQGALVLYQSPNQFEHSEFASHILAEKQIEKNGGIAWEKTPGAQNHFLDGTYAALCAGTAVLGAATLAASKPTHRPTARELAERAKAK